MRNVSANYLIAIFFFVVALVGCKQPDLDVSSLGKKLPAPSLKGTSPFDQDMDVQGYVRIQGRCDTRIGNIFLSFNKNVWHQPPLHPDTTGTTLAAGTANDRDCSDGSFDIYLTKNDIQNIWGISANSDADHVSYLYIKGESLIGDTETLTLVNSSGPYDPAPFKLTLEKMWPRSHAGSGRCDSFRVNVVNKQGERVPASSAIHFSIEELSRMVPIGAYLNWQECSTGAAATQTVFTIPAKSDGTDIFYKFPDGPPDKTLNFRILPPPALSADTAYMPVTIRDSSPSSSYRWLSVDDSPSQIYKNICYPLIVRSRLYDYSWAYETDSSVNFSSSNSQLKFYSDENCTTQTSKTSFSASSELTAYIKYSPLPSETESFKNFTITLTGESPSYKYDTSPINMRVDLTSKGAISALDIWGPKNIVSGSCNGFRVVSMNDNGTLLTASSPISVTLGTFQSGTGEFFADYSCTTMPISSATIPVGWNFSTIYFKAGALFEGTDRFKISSVGLSARSPEFIAARAPTHLKIAPDLSVGSCKKFSIGLTDATGTAAYPSPYNMVVSLEMHFSSSPIGDRFFSDANCSAPLSSNNVTISAGSQQSSIYVDSTGLSGITLSISANAPGFMNNSLNVTF